MFHIYTTEQPSDQTLLHVFDVPVRGKSRKATVDETITAIEQATHVMFYRSDFPRSAVPKDKALELFKVKNTETISEELNNYSLPAQANKIESVLKELAVGRIFSVQFIKRTTGELRKMVCRFGVNKNLSDNGEKRSYEPNDKGLISVYDVQKQGYRMISVEGIQEIKVGGETYCF